MVVEALFEGRCKDVIICPISVGYDRVIETESYVDELLGKPKERESLGKLASSTLLLQPKWGRLDGVCYCNMIEETDAIQCILQSLTLCGSMLTSKSLEDHSKQSRLIRLMMVRIEGRF